jgi:sugar-specific transcriptional regulator TrmB
MQADPFEFEGLLKLGLTITQTKVYLALIKTGNSKPADIANHTNINRPDVYCTLDELFEKGLLYKIPEKPVRFKAINLDDGIKLLLERKKIELNKRVEQAKQLTEVYRENQFCQPTNSSFSIIKNKKLTKTVSNYINESITNFEFVMTWKRFAYRICDVYRENLLNAKKRGVKGRFIVEQPHNTDYLRDRRIQQIAVTHKVSYIKECPRNFFGISDSKQCFVITNFPKKDQVQLEAISTNNPNLTTILSDYFEKLWQTSTELSI